MTYNVFGLLLTFALLFASNLVCQAFEIKGDVWVLSEVVTNSVLKEKLKEAEFYALNRNPSEAASSLKTISKDFPNIKTTEGEPLELATEGAKLWYKAKSSSFKDQEIVSEAEKLLKIYAKKAEDKSWNSYKYLFHRIRDYYFNKKDYENVLKIQKELVLYDVLDNWAIDSYLEYLKSFSLTDDTENFFKEIVKRGGKISPKMELQLIKLSLKNKEKDSWKTLLIWFDNNRRAEIGILREAIDIASLNLDASNHDMVKTYYVTLTNVILAQVANEENMPKIAELLNERQKIKTVCPEIFK